MKHISGEKEKAIALRKQGKTYSEILAKIPVAKSTLSLWLHDVGLDVWGYPASFVNGPPMKVWPAGSEFFPSSDHDKVVFLAPSYAYAFAAEAVGAWLHEVKYGKRKKGRGT